MQKSRKYNTITKNCGDDYEISWVEKNASRIHKSLQSTRRTAKQLLLKSTWRSRTTYTCLIILNHQLRGRQS